MLKKLSIQFFQCSMSNPCNKLALGTAQFGMNYGVANKNGQVGKRKAMAILDFAYSVGINTLDTAKDYRSSEEVIGYYLKDQSVEDWHIITKVNTKANSIESQINDSIDKLGTIPEIVLVHSTVGYLNRSFCKALHRLKETQNIKQVGVSVYTCDEIQKVLSFLHPDVIQCPLNILDTKLLRNGLLDKIKGYGIDIHIRSVFLQGLFYLADKRIQKNFADALQTIKQLRLIAQNAELTLAELSLLWVCSLEQVDKIIIGVDNVEQLEAHQKTLKKKVDRVFFQEALNIKYENENILNPSLW